MIYDPVRDRVVIFGGYDAGPQEEGFRNDTWELSLTGTPTWTQLAPTDGPPTARDLIVPVYDPWFDRMVFFVGPDLGRGRSDACNRLRRPR
jgi:hypothetical protein